MIPDLSTLQLGAPDARARRASGGATGALVLSYFPDVTIADPAATVFYKEKLLTTQKDAFLKLLRNGAAFVTSYDDTGVLVARSYASGEGDVRRLRRLVILLDKEGTNNEAGGYNYFRPNAVRFENDRTADYAVRMNIEPLAVENWADQLKKEQMEIEVLYTLYACLHKIGPMVKFVAFYTQKCFGVPNVSLIFIVETGKPLTYKEDVRCGVPPFGNVTLFDLPPDMYTTIRERIKEASNLGILMADLKPGNMIKMQDKNRLSGQADTGQPDYTIGFIDFDPSFTVVYTKDNGVPPYTCIHFANLLAFVVFFYARYYTDWTSAEDTMNRGNNRACAAVTECRLHVEAQLLAAKEFLRVAITDLCELLQNTENNTAYICHWLRTHTQNNNNSPTPQPQTTQQQQQQKDVAMFYRTVLRYYDNFTYTARSPLTKDIPVSDQLLRILTNVFRTILGYDEESQVTPCDLRPQQMTNPKRSKA